MKKNSRDEFISTLAVIPSSLAVDDIKDMFFIAEQHFLNKTPPSIQVLDVVKENKKVF